MAIPRAELIRADGARHLCAGLSRRSSKRSLQEGKGMKEKSPMREVPLAVCPTPSVYETGWEISVMDDAV